MSFAMPLATVARFITAADATFRATAREEVR
jgi:hypothetical protein